MDFRAIREELLKINAEEFANEYGINVAEVEKMEKTNEVPIALVRQMSKNSGISVASLLKYEKGLKGTNTGQDENVKEGLESQFSLFTIKENMVVIPQFKAWLEENKEKLDFSEEEVDWLAENIAWILDLYDRTIQDELQDGEEGTSKEEAIEYMQDLFDISQKEIERLEFIINNRLLSQKVIKNAVNLEASRLMKEDEIFDNCIEKLIDAKERKLKEVYEILLDLSTPQSVEEIIRSCDKGENYFERINDVMFEVGRRKEEELVDEVDCIVNDKDGIKEFYSSGLRKLFDEAPQLNSFSVNSSYNMYYSYGYYHPEELNITYTEVTEDERKERDNAHKKRTNKKLAGNVVKNVLFPPAALYDIATMNSKKSFAKDVAMCIEDYKIRDDIFDVIIYRYSLIVTPAAFALEGITEDWKEYFENMIKLVHEEDRFIIERIEKEKKKVLLSKTVMDALLEVK